MRSILTAGEHELYISAVSSWEIATKHRIGKLPGVEALLEDFEAQMELAGFTMLSITSAHGRKAGTLPGKHGDPFDRMLAAQALLEGLAVLSNDRRLDEFGVQRIW